MPSITTPRLLEIAFILCDFHFLQVSSNGLITLTDSTDEPYTKVEYRNVRITAETNPYISVLPFYANIDISESLATSQAGTIYSRLSSDKNDPAMKKADNLIKELCEYEKGYESETILVATWIKVGRYQRNSTLVSH